MTTWTVLDAHGHRGQVEIDDVTTRTDGSLVGLRRVDGSKPVHLVAVFVVAGGRWVSAWADGAEIVWETDTPTPPPAPAPPAPPRTLSNATDIPDDAVFGSSRRAVVDAKLATFNRTDEP